MNVADRVWRVVLLLMLAMMLLSVSAYAQNMDFSGEWAPIMHEDAPERAGGPELADYLGFRSMMRPVREPIRGKHRYRRFRNGSAVRTRPITSSAVPRSCASPRKWIR